MANLRHYDRFADLFDYPGRDYPVRVQRAQEVVTSKYPAAVSSLDNFAKALPSEGGPFTQEELDEVQEIFTRSFDVQAVTTLGVGYVMFGDDYKRGELLVNLNRELRDVGIETGTELPDHLPTILRLLAVWQDSDLVTEFVEEILHPALEMMIQEFGPERRELRDKMYRKHNKTLIDSSETRGVMFREPLVGLLEVLKEDFALSERTWPERESDFLRSVTREFEIEEEEGSPKPSRGTK
jgi:nitrate reductase assembly molybdenum cofactor insertion protein NarJ